MPVNRRIRAESESFCSGKTMPAGPAYCLEMTHDYRTEAHSKDPHHFPSKAQQTELCFGNVCTDASRSEP